MQNPKVAIIILNWNGKNDTLECLDSIFKIEYTNFEVILVDNNSTDGSQDTIKKEFPKAHLIRNKINLGFTGGNNVGIKYALSMQADYMLLLNNDTTLEKNFLHALLKPFEKDSTIGMTGPKVVYYNEPTRIWCAGCDYNRFIGRGKMRDSKNSEDFTKPDYVDWISFCAVLIKKEVFDKIGLLDDKYFSSYEDLDFCLNAKWHGYQCYYIPDTTVYHKIAKDWKGLTNPLYVYYQTRNNLFCLQKNRKPLQYIISLAYYFGVSLPRRSISFIKNRETYKIKYLLMGIKDFASGSRGIGHLSQSIKDELERAKQLIIGLNARYLQRKVTGIERYTTELIKRLPKIATDKKFTFFFCGHETIPDLNLPENSSFYVTKHNTKNRTLRILWEQYLLGREIKQQCVKVFHGPSFVVPLIKPCKYVVTVHDLSYYLFPESLTFSTRLYFSIFLPISLKRADRIIADSYSTKRDLMRLFRINENKIQVIHLGVDKFYSPVKDKKAIAEIRKNYSLPERFILFIGMLSPRKNLPRMLNAFAVLKQKGFPHKFVVVGARGWLYEAIFAQVQSLNLAKEVVFTNYVPDKDIPIFYTLADLFLFTTLYEGFGLPILEAMACGCPVITSTTSSMPEVAGDAALLVDPTNVEAIAGAMEKVLTNKQLRQELVSKGFKQVRKFSWERVAKETLEVYALLSL